MEVKEEICEDDNKQINLNRKGLKSTFKKEEQNIKIKEEIKCEDNQDKSGKSRRKICKICHQTFFSSSNLKRHYKRKHQNSVEDILDLIDILEETFRCINCGKEFDHPDPMRLHLQIHEEQPEEMEFKCPLCSFCVPKSSLIQSMHKHFYNEHGIILIEHELEFDSKERFENWKRQEEQATMSRFVVKTGHKYKTTGYEVKRITYLRCQRSGFYKPLGTGKRAPRKVGSKKINGFCPARIKVIEDRTTGVCYVNYINTHVGHSAESDVHLKHFTKQDRQLIRSKIQSGMSFKDILDEVKYSDNLNLRRLTTKDLSNIKLSLLKGASDQDKLNMGKIRTEQHQSKYTDNDLVQVLMEGITQNKTEDETYQEEEDRSIKIIELYDPNVSVTITEECEENATHGIEEHENETEENSNENEDIADGNEEDTSENGSPKRRKISIIPLEEKKEAIKNRLCAYIDLISSEEDLDRIEDVVNLIF